MDPVESKQVSVSASFELHQIDLAHGSFFAMHRPLLGITNGPMFANTNTSDDTSSTMADSSSVNASTTTSEGDQEGKFPTLTHCPNRLIWPKPYLHLLPGNAYSMHSIFYLATRDP